MKKRLKNNLIRVLCIFSAAALLITLQAAPAAVQAAENAGVSLSAIPMSTPYSGQGLSWMETSADVYGNVYGSSLRGITTNTDNLGDFALYGQYQSFSGTVIRNAGTNPATDLLDPYRRDIVVRIYGDGILLYESGSVNLAGNEIQRFTISVAGVNTLRVSINGTNYIRLADAFLSGGSPAPTAAPAPQTQPVQETQPAPTEPAPPQTQAAQPVSGEAIPVASVYLQDGIMGGTQESRLMHFYAYLEERRAALAARAEAAEASSESPETSAEPARQADAFPLDDTPIPDPNNLIDLSTTLYTYEKMEKDLYRLAGNHRDFISLESAGKTHDGRELYVVYFGNRNAPRQIYICAATHAREYMTTQLVMKQLEYYSANYYTGNYAGQPFQSIFENTCFVIMPMINPDGVSISQLGEGGLRRADLVENLRNIYAADVAGGFTSDDYVTYLVRWKANAAGVDINRNFSPGWETVTERAIPSSTFYKGSAPGSEAESTAQMNVINSLSNPLLALSYHSYGDLVYWQYGQPEPLWSANEQLASRISAMTGQYLAGYSNEAGFSNWCVLVKGIPSVTCETGTVPAPLPLDQFPELWGEHMNMWVMLATSY